MNPLSLVTRQRNSTPPLPSDSSWSDAVAVDSERGSSVSLAVNTKAPGTARQHVRQIAQAQAVGDDVLGVVQLLVSELVTNVLRHERSTLVDVEVLVDADLAVTVTVCGSAGTVALPMLHPMPSTDTSRSTGRGLAILDALATTWGVRRATGRTAVWFTVAQPEAAQGRPTDDPAQVVLATASAITAATAADLTAAPDVVATLAAHTAEQAVLGAAAKSAAAAKAAREARARAAKVAAEAVAATAAATVRAVQQEADEVAREVADAATAAAATVSMSIVPGGDKLAARVALQLQAAVVSAAAATSEQTARTADTVARAVAAAAAAVAATTTATAAADEHEAAEVADAVRAVAAAAAEELANDTVERGAAVGLVARDATRLSERLQRANQRLIQAGSENHKIALALQAAMLTQLPRSDDIELAARYLTAAKQAQVGGDWYDALVLDGRSTTLVIGDVIGHDIAAAAMMGQLRNLLRALAWDRHEPPSVVVARLDRAMRDLRVDTIASLLMLNIEAPEQHTAAGHTLRWTNAGHPAPILVHADGTAVLLDPSTDVLLGVKADVVRADHVQVAPPGATLVLYTDGLIETREADIEAGQDRLLYSLATNHHLELGRLLDTVVWEMVGDQPGDDVAVLAARLT
jgi:serine phosphatase RsbU (regulator of sigma subunit)/anti-sigma regulatory factor (Ser/Thr protein kinase)